MKSKNIVLVLFCMLFSIILLMSSASAILTWNKFGGEYSSITQSQFESVNSRFDEATILTDTTANGYSAENSNIPYQAVVGTIIQNENYLILANNNYLQIYDKDLNLVNEKFTNISTGQIALVNFDNGSLNNDVAGYWRVNPSILQFRVYNIEEDFTINETISVNMSLGENNTYTNGVRCKSGECYAFLSELSNATTYLLYLQIATYNATSGSADFTTYSIDYDINPMLEPPSWIDWDYDSTEEFLGFSEGGVYVVSYNGALEKKYNTQNSTVGAKFIKTDASNLYKVLIVRNQPNPCTSPTFNCIKHYVYKSDGSLLWQNEIGSTNSADTYRSGGTAIGDYNGDGYDDVFAVLTKRGTNKLTTAVVYRGDTGASLYSQDMSNTLASTNTYPNTQLTLAHLNRDTTLDFIGFVGSDVYMWDTADASFYKSDTISGGGKSCIPADLTYDNLLDVICVSPTTTKLYIANYTNQNAYITSVTYDPSTTILVNSTLWTYTSATDPEADSPLYYSIKCNDSASWTSDTTSSAQSCFFSTLGQFNVSVKVRDFFHSDYYIFSQIITVTQTGEVCDNDGICEAGQGETYINCPNDCLPPSENYTQSEGGMVIPTELVDTTNYRQGLLPEIYYGTLAFFSKTLLPFIILIFAIFTVLIILTLGTIIKKIAQRVGN